MVEPGPWPGRTLIPSSNAITFVFSDLISVGKLPPGRSVRPTLPAKSVSPVKSSASSSS